MADEVLTAADLKEYRSLVGYSQAQAADSVGLHVSTWKTYESGKTKVSRRVDRAVRRHLARHAASSDPGGVDDGASSSPPSQSEQAAGAPWGGAGDLPPLAEPPDPPEGDYVQMPGGSRPVSISRLDHFSRLELSILTLLAGKDIVYLVSDSGGKPQRQTSHQPGLADLFPPADRAAIVEGAPRIAHAWVEWARTNRRVDAFLSLMIIEGGFSGVLVATLPVVLTILGNHGLDPLGWVQRQIAPPTPVPAAANGDGPDERYYEPGVFYPDADSAAADEG